MSRLHWAGVVVVAVVVVAIAAAGASNLLGGDDTNRIPAPPSTTSRSAEPVAVSLPPPLRPPPASTGLLLVGASSQPVSLIVQTVDDGAVWSVPIPDVQRGQSVYRLVSVGSSVIALVAGSFGQGPVWSYNSDALHGQAPPIRLGDGIDVLVDPGGGPRVTIVSAQPSAHFFVQSIDIDGTGATMLVPIPEGFGPEASVIGGYVLQGSQERRPVMRLWNPDDRTFIADIGVDQSPVFMAAAGSTVVWRAPNSTIHALHLYDTTTGADTEIFVGDSLVVGHEGDQPTASTDGSHVALGLESATEAAFSGGVVDVTSRQFHVSPIGDYPGTYSWSPDGRWLFVETHGGLSLYDQDARLIGLLAGFDDSNRLQPKAVAFAAPHSN